MATTFKELEPKDIVSTRSLLHEAIPLTGAIVSGTYINDANIKNYSHGMFQSVYDYPFLSSSANHIFDITAGYSKKSSLSGTSGKTQQDKKGKYGRWLGTLFFEEKNINEWLIKEGFAEVYKK